MIFWVSPISPESAILEYFSGFGEVGRASIGFVAPWRFISTKFQPEIFDFEPVRPISDDSGCFGSDSDTICTCKQPPRSKLSQPSGIGSGPS